MTAGAKETSDVGETASTRPGSHNEEDAEATRMIPRIEVPTDRDADPARPTDSTGDSTDDDADTDDAPDGGGDNGDTTVEARLPPRPPGRGTGSATAPAKPTLAGKGDTRDTGDADDAEDADSTAVFQIPADLRRTLATPRPTPRPTPGPPQEAAGTRPPPEALKTSGAVATPPRESTTGAPPVPASSAVSGVSTAIPGRGLWRQLTGTGGGPRSPMMERVASWLPFVLTLQGLFLYVLALRLPPGPLRGVDLNEIDGLGLISALPTTAFIAIGIMIVAFFVTIGQNTDRRILLLFQLTAITFALHGAAAMVESEPRFHTAYVHAGFVDYIARGGEAAPIIDARFAWPGFFALFAFITRTTGVTDLTPILQWTPLLTNLLYLLPFVIILRQVLATTRARWFAALLFIIVQWIGQDYFSPQGLTFALYLAFVAILLRWFGRVEPRSKPIPPSGLRRLIAKLDALTPGELSQETRPYDRLILLGLLVLIFIAATASHQITPFMMMGVLAGLLLLRRTSLTWALPFAFGLVVLSWISYQTTTFWRGNLGTIFGGLGRFLANLRTNTGDRIEGTDAVHQIVLQTRLGICGVILLLAAIGLIRRLRRGVADRAAILLLCVPVTALGLQSYGGEIGLRIYLFALPGACLMAAYAFFPNVPEGNAGEETVPLRRRNVGFFNPALTRKISLVLAACFALAFAGTFLVARYGNEKFERVTTPELTAMRYLYEQTDPTATVLYLVPKLGEEVTPLIPWRERKVGNVGYGQALVDKDPTKISGIPVNADGEVLGPGETDPGGPGSLVGGDGIPLVPWVHRAGDGTLTSGVLESLRGAWFGKDQPQPNTYLIVSRGQFAYMELSQGFPPDWGEKFRQTLDTAPELRRVFANEDAAIYVLRKRPAGAIPPPVSPSGPGDPSSPWTPVGLVALAGTWIALFAYEVMRIHGPDRAPRARRRMLFVAAPAFMIALAVIVERFLVIGLTG